MQGCVKAAGFPIQLESTVGIGMQTEFRILAFDEDVVASQSHGRIAGTPECDRLAVLPGDNSVDAPSTNYGVGDSGSVRRKFLTLAKWQIVAGAEVEDVSNVIRSQAVVTLNSPAGNAGRSILITDASVEQVAGITERFRPSVGSEEA